MKSFKLKPESQDIVKVKVNPTTIKFSEVMQLEDQHSSVIKVENQSFTEPIIKKVVKSSLKLNSIALKIDNK